MDERERLYTVKEVCEILHKTRRTIYAYIRSGQLKAHRPGKKNFLIAESDLNEFITAGVRPGYFQELYPRPHKRSSTNKVVQE